MRFSRRKTGDLTCGGSWDLRDLEGILPLKELCSKISNRHKAPGIPMRIPGALCLSRGNMLSIAAIKKIAKG